MSKGWYRYGLVFAAQHKGEHYRMRIVLERESASGLVELSKEEAEQVLKHVGTYMSTKADFSNLKEEF